jgi:hypothetical protein
VGSIDPPILTEPVYNNWGNKPYKEVFIAVTNSGWMAKTHREDLMEKFIDVIKTFLNVGPSIA